MKPGDSQSPPEKKSVPQFGLLSIIRSGNGPAFVADAVQILTKSLTNTWKLHTAYRPQSSGKAEQMNCTQKGTRAEFCQGTSLPWPDLLPLTPLHAHGTPGTEDFFPFELVYERPPPLPTPLCLDSLPGDLRQVGDTGAREQPQALGATLNKLQQYTTESPSLLRDPSTLLPGWRVSLGQN